MDEKYLEQAAAIAQAAHDDAVQNAARAMSGTGQADCDECGEPIAPARRAAFPAAMRCFFCQTAHEQRRAAFAGGPSY